MLVEATRLAYGAAYAALAWFEAFGQFLENHAGAITATATVFIGYFTFTLYRATNQLKAIGEQQAEALMNLERPWLFMEAVRVERLEGAPIQPAIPNNWYISFRWRNVGRAPAVIEDCVIKIEPTDSLPDVPDYGNGSQLTCPATVAKDVEFETSQVGPGDEKRVRNGEVVNLTAYGRLTYRELGGVLHHTGFAMDVSPNLPAASTHRNKEYDYYD